MRARVGRLAGPAALAAAAGVLAVAAHPASAPPAWPQFGFDSGGSRFNPGEHELSRTSVRALREVWRRDLGEEIWSSATVADGTVYVGERGGNLCALRAATGSVSWCRRLHGTPAAAALAGRRLVVATDSSQLYGLDRATGALEWRRVTGTMVGGFPAPPTVSGTTAFVNSGEETLAADTRTGRTVWSQFGECFSCSVAVDDASAYVAAHDGDLGLYLNAYRRADGRLRRRTRLDREVSSSVVLAGATLFTLDLVEHGEGAARAYAYTFTARAAATGRLRWERRFGDGTRPTFATPAAADGAVYAAVPDGTLRAFDVASGARRWSVPLPPTDSSPAVANRVLYVAAGGALRAYDTTDGRLLRALRLGAVSRSSPVVAGGAVYVGDDAGVVHAFRVRQTLRSR